MERQSDIPRPSDPECREKMERQASGESEAGTKAAAGDEDRRAQARLHGSAKYPGREAVEALFGAFSGVTTGKQDKVRGLPAHHHIGRQSRPNGGFSGFLRLFHLVKTGVVTGVYRKERNNGR